MLKDIIAVEPRENYQLYIRFEDEVEGIINVSKLIKFTGVFAPLQEQKYFAQVELNHELGTIQWRSGADLDSDVLYAVISNQPIPKYNSLRLT
ncbi:MULTISPECIES: DUF2442 domain-containing protein [unclassified Nostoc]|uniref:DUF2442 domain-containing protein n=1 Tax=unclassified Nostoc TaxID=2593658 RepID=UPI002AD4C5E8|nr:DUF2442 domain-containing protein [Nostoc sp. DedQUE03]MDZ7970964.1 DUF2442 domain-containing protein [Nostoc sp. DedQUE03]MDZ8046859.1 DUF2442 domain-containing protein [Nostoc sp. DedQUE02]